MEDFPTSANFISQSELQAEMNYLGSHPPHIETREYIIVNMAPDRSINKRLVTPLRGNILFVPEYTKLDLLSGIFTGIQRAKCRRSDEAISQYEYWHKNKEALIREVGTDPQKLDAALWKSVMGCGAFKPRVASGVMRHFNATRVLDFSSGWGDRLLAAIALGVRYVGVDPNTELHSGYQRMIDSLAKKPEMYTMIEAEFQSALLPEESFDLVFTSPPYFDLELYSTEVASSLDVWKTEFLYTSIEKAWSVLEIGGNLCLSINDYKRVKYVADMVRYTSSLPGAQSLNSVYREKCVPYLASASFVNSKEYVPAASPLWAWKKLEARPVDSKMNPPIVIEQHKIDSRTLHVIRDDLLEGSSKQRGAYPYLASYSEDYNEFVYAGYEGGHGPLCIAIVAEALGKKATLFLQSSTGKDNELVSRSRSHGARVYLIRDKLYVVTNEALKYVDRTTGSLFVPLGIDNAEYQGHMIRALRSVFPSDVRPKRMWVIAGSGRMQRVLQQLLPDTQIISVQIGREVAQADYISEYKLTQEARQRDLPPYPSSRSYDAKLWPYVLKDGQDGDYIWNIAS